MAALKTGERRGSRPQPPEAGARSASLEPGRSLVYFNTVAPRRSAFLPPSSADHFRELDASIGASGPHDFAVRKHTLSSVAWFASTASRPAFVTIAKRPSERDGTAADIDLIWVFGKSEYFLRKGVDRLLGDL